MLLLDDCVVLLVVPGLLGCFTCPPWTVRVFYSFSNEWYGILNVVIVGLGIF